MSEMILQRHQKGIFHEKYNNWITMVGDYRGHVDRYSFISYIYAPNRTNQRIRMVLTPSPGFKQDGGLTEMKHLLITLIFIMMITIIIMLALIPDSKPTSTEEWSSPVSGVRTVCVGKDMVFQYSTDIEIIPGHKDCQ